MRRSFALALASTVTSVVALSSTPAHAEPPQGSLAEVILETGDTTGNPYAAILDGWWGHEAGKGPDGTGSTFISLNAADSSGEVTTESIAALHEALNDGGTFDNVRVAFVPASPDGSNERPQVSEGESASEVFQWFANLGMGSALAGVVDASDPVTTVSTAAEYDKWWDSGRPLQGYTDALDVLDVANDGATRPAPAPQGRSILNRWPAGERISLVLYVSDGLDDRQVPTVAVGPDGKALTAWLTFRTVAAPSNPARSSAGYQVLTGAGTGPAAAPAGSAQGGSSGSSTGEEGSESGGSEGSKGSSPGDGGTTSGAGDGSATEGSGATGDGGSESSDTGTGFSTPLDGNAGSVTEDDGVAHAVTSATPGGAPTLVGLLVLAALTLLAWVVASRRRSTASSPVNPGLASTRGDVGRPMNEWPAGEPGAPSSRPHELGADLSRTRPTARTNSSERHPHD